MRPLRLKSEVFTKVETQLAAHNSVAHVWVDNGIYHLDQTFDYAIPASLDSSVSVGVRIEVPFNGKSREGLVIARVESSIEKLKSISKVISPIPVANDATIALIAAVAARWAAHPYDVIRSAIPPRVASIEKNFQANEISEIRSIKPSREFIQLPPFKNPLEALSQFIRNVKGQGSTLVIVPESRIANQLHDLHPDSVLLDSDLERSARYRNFLAIANRSQNLVIGTRSAIFAPINNLQRILIFNEGSEHHYERRSPGWNVRDVAILRSQIQAVSLTFLGYSPSSEIARLIENRWISYRTQRQSVKVRNSISSNSELLPGRIFSEIRSGLKGGSVLFIVPRKGYAQAISCSKCRNIARCDCGGKLLQPNQRASIQCALCGKVQAEWRCSWCHNSTPFLIGRGSLRFAHEIGAAFPGVAIKQSEGDHILADVDDHQGIVIATPGSIPQKSGGYSRVVILEGSSYFSQSDIRAHERAREMFFGSASYLSSDGVLITVLDESHPIIGALGAWKPSIVSQQELRERQSAGLPPFSRALTLDADSTEMRSIIKGLEAAHEQGRLPESTKILGPISTDAGKSRIVVMSSVDQGDALTHLIHEFQRRRSAAKKTLASLRIDPYSLTR